jgi:hypothetical protein
MKVQNKTRCCQYKQGAGHLLLLISLLMKCMENDCLAMDESEHQVFVQEQKPANATSIPQAHTYVSLSTTKKYFMIGRASIKLDKQDNEYLKKPSMVLLLVIFIRCYRVVVNERKCTNLDL